MNRSRTEPLQRIDFVDALRGSALLGIAVSHAIAHWGLRIYPTQVPAWLARFDAWTLRSCALFVDEKAFAIFALLFGVSFFLILDRWQGRGPRVGRLFLWRLALLSVFGYLNGIVYSGDFLLTIAILGLPLIGLDRLGDRALAWLAAALLLQAPDLWETGRMIVDPGHRPPPAAPWVLYEDLFRVYTQGSLRDVCATNILTGQIARLWWALESGRYLQTLGLFVAGMLIGRSRVLESLPRSLRLARAGLPWGLAAVLTLHLARRHLPATGLDGAVVDRASGLLAAYRNLAQVAVWCSLFVLLQRWIRTRRALGLLAPCGRMSLTCYVAQGLIGVPLFYGYGLALFRHLGPLASAGVGVALFSAQSVGAHLWLSRFRYGPLEWFWRACTFRDFTIALRRAERRPAGRIGTSPSQTPAAGSSSSHADSTS